MARGFRIGHPKHYVTAPAQGSYAVTGQAVAFPIGGGGDITAPTVPGTPVVTVLSSSALGLTWPASTDNVAVTQYRLQRKTGAGSFATVLPLLSINSKTDVGLSASTTYQYQVAAGDAANNFSAYSAIGSGTTSSAATGLSGPHIGGNFDTGDSRDSPWADLVSNSRGFQPAGAFAIGNNYEDLGMARDVNGWPTVACELVLATSGNQLSSITGTYAGSYDDSGSSNPSLISSANCSINSIVRVGTHVTFNFVVSSSTFTAIFAFTGGVRNLSIIAPGYTSSDVLITPAIDYYKKFACLRAMDFMQTNGNITESTWAQRTTANKRHGKKSWEALFSFITAVYNAPGSNLKAVWICVPVAATEAYTSSLATLAATNLPGALVVYFELSNELWNYGAAFPQTPWMDAWANNPANPDYARVRGVGPPSTTPGYYDAKANYWGLAFARMARAARSVLGTRARPVLAGQLGNTTWVNMSTSFLAETTQTNEFGAFSSYANAISGAPYLQCFGYEDSVGTAALLNTAFKNQITALGSQFSAYKTKANTLGVEVICYEAGTDMTSDNNIAVKRLAWADSTSSPDNAQTVAYGLIKAMWNAGWTTCCWYDVTPNKINASGTIWYSMWCTNQGFSDSTARGAAMNQLIAEFP